MEAILLEDYDYKLNDHFYAKGQKVDVVEIKDINGSYAVYRYGGLDWLPKNLVRII